MVLNISVWIDFKKQKQNKTKKQLPILTIQNYYRMQQIYLNSCKGYRSYQICLTRLSADKTSRIQICCYSYDSYRFFMALVNSK
jgi:hypothetical protein